MDSYGLDYCGYCWENAIDGLIQHHDNCKIGNAQALADKRLELLKRLEWIVRGSWFTCSLCGREQSEGHHDDCELAEVLDANR